jgi:hypothetical protein
LEIVTGHAPVALRVVDVATGAAVADGLDINITPRFGGRPQQAIVNTSGIWSAHGVSGLHGYEFGSADDIAARRAARRPFRVTINDPGGNFLAVAFDADLPSDGFFVEVAAPSSPPLTSLAEWPLPPGVAGVPLFSAPSRAVPGSLAVLRAELREAGTERPAAAALLAASVDGTNRGLGLADQLGRVLVLFPYPEPAGRAMSSPPAATVFRWSVELTAFYIPRAAGTAAADVPDLAAVLAQLAAPPQRLLASVGSPTVALGPLLLDDRGPLVVRSGLAPPLSPYLYLDAA